MSRENVEVVRGVQFLGRVGLDRLMHALRHAFLVVWALALLGPGTAAAATSDTIQVRVESKGTLIGGSIEVGVRVKCEPFGEPFERNITVTQDDQSIFAQTGLPDAPCDRTWQTVTAIATPFDGSFHPGRAFASAFVSRIDPTTGEIRQGQDTRTIQVR